MGLPEDKVTIILMLVADILITIFREVIALTTRNNESQRGAAIGSVALLCFLGFLVFPVVNLLLYLLSRRFADSSTHNCLSRSRRVIIVVVQTLGATLYIYGDNIGYILQNYSEELGCGTQCITNNRIAAILTLGLALVILQLFPITFKKCDVVIKDWLKYKDWDDKTSPWNNGLDLITIIVKIDILYTTVVVMTQTNEFCGLVDLALSGTFIAFCMLAGIIHLVVTACYARAKIGSGSPFIIFSCILLALSLCMYLLADNEQPLDCGFGCDTFAANQTMNKINCKVKANGELRLGFMSTTFAIVTSLAVIWFCCGICTDKTEDEVDETVTVHSISGVI